MVSFCLQDKVQTAWQGTHVFYDLALSCSLSFICGRALHPRRLSGVDSLRRFVLCTFRPHGRLEGGRGSHGVPSLGFFLQGLSVAPSLYPKSTRTGFLPAAAVLNSGCSSLQRTVRPRGHNEFQLWLVPGELRLPLGFL